LIGNIDGSGIIDQSTQDGSTLNPVEATDAYDCCVQCLTTSDCQQFWYSLSSGACTVITPGDVCSAFGQYSGTAFYSTSTAPDTDLIVGNGNCGSWDQSEYVAPDK